MNFLAILQWDPSPICFTFPIIKRPVAWYGVFFALGFLITYWVFRYIALHEVYEAFFSKTCDNSSLEKKSEKRSISFTWLKTNAYAFAEEAQKRVDQVTLHVVIGLLVGARLGYVFFYGWPIYRDNLLGIFKVWEGGLASHGACLGILTALFVLVNKLKKTLCKWSYLYLIDLMALFSGFFACCIRIGNFMNQEILGKVTHKPWAIEFLSPFDGLEVLPRHPVQLYEAIFYILLAISLVLLWKKRTWAVGRGTYAGVFLTALFSFRFFVEFFKEPQGYVLPLAKGLTMGQYLSLPFILLGLTLTLYSLLKDKQPYKPSQF